MDVVIRRLTPDLVDDYLYFFDHVEFMDHPEWSQCYCLHFHFENAWDAEDEGKDSPWRERAARFVCEGKIQGYLAYADGQVAGWCGANDRENYHDRLTQRKELQDRASRGKRVKSIVCFTVAPALRGHGIATRLLARVCEDAAREGYELLEAYPARGGDCYAHHHGLPALYEKFGFFVYKKNRRSCVMRRDL